MKIPIVVVLLCGILSVKGSPVETVQSSKTAVEPLSAESLEDSQSAADSVELVDGPKVPEGLPVVHANTVEPVTQAIGEIVVEKVPQRIDASAAEKVSEHIDVSAAEKVSEHVNVTIVEKIPEHVNVTVVEKIPEHVNVTVIEKIPEHVNVTVVEKAPEHSNVTVDEKVSEHATVAQSLVQLGTQKLIAEDFKPVVKPASESSVFASTSPVESIPSSSHGSRRVGPVELGVRNLVAASAVAAEELYLEMSAMNAETSHMINSKSEILTAHTMNELYEPLNKIETEIKISEDCGKGYVSALNMIFKDVDINLRECTKNLTAIDQQYKSQNSGNLNSLSTSAEEIYSLTESCEIATNFAVGTFCIINNLAEANDRVVSEVNAIKENTILVKEKTQKAVASTEVCQQNLVKNVNGKVNNLLKEIDEKCVQRKPSRS